MSLLCLPPPCSVSCPRVCSLRISVSNLPVSLCLCLSPFLIPFCLPICLSPLSPCFSLSLLLSPSLCPFLPFSRGVSFPGPVSPYLSPFTSISPPSFPNFSPASQVLCPHTGWVDTTLIPQGGPPPPSCLVLTSCFVVICLPRVSPTVCLCFDWSPFQRHSPEKAGAGGRWICPSSGWFCILLQAHAKSWPCAKCVGTPVGYIGTKGGQVLPGSHCPRTTTTGGRDDFPSSKVCVSARTMTGRDGGGSVSVNSSTSPHTSPQVPATPQGFWTAPWTSLLSWHLSAVL